jgi:hypothetical protein
MELKKITECISSISSIIELVCDDTCFAPINGTKVIKILNSICKIINISPAMTIEQFIENFTIIESGLRNIGTESLDDAK